VLGGVAAGILPVATLVALAAAPLAWQVYRGLQRFYTQPYALMPVMSTNIKLHLYVGLLLLAGYGVTIAYRLVSLD
jgi:1,4-dihydroxy-2-naphthoate octaprenyltransferase